MLLDTYKKPVLTDTPSRPARMAPPTIDNKKQQMGTMTTTQLTHDVTIHRPQQRLVSLKYSPIWSTKTMSLETPMTTPCMHVCRYA